MHGHGGGGGAGTLDLILLGLAALAVVAYASGMVTSRRQGRAWPTDRLGLWAVGIAAAAATVVGPLAEKAHDDFMTHMAAHLSGGMIAPLLLVLAAPVTLALRTLHVTPARRISRLLRSAPARFIAHPVTAGVLSAGGLWVLYLTPLFEAMQAIPLLHVIVQAHLLITGYIFTAAIIGLDPAPHAPSRMLRAVVLVLSMASHAVLAKYLYANPPAGVAVPAAHDGAQLMYYGGALIEVVIVIIFCAQWYRETGRRLAPRDAEGKRVAAGKRLENGERHGAATPTSV
ncbi:cytochrome c oxidase assembly protein [Microbacterium sp. JZ31]|uniref:cytochrome c oxidase assembly protein n=1 Tax=Microbacterium sp. JZ31 TaxID=1906274 RepID=UPI001932ACA9|nr:cytochrome c oxidase assembly protein [Microbacterium sp. JZ31]